MDPAQQSLVERKPIAQYLLGLTQAARQDACYATHAKRILDNPLRGRNQLTPSQQPHTQSTPERPTTCPQTKKPQPKKISNADSH